MKKKLQLLLLLLIPSVTYAQEKGLDQQIDEAFKPISDFFSQVTVSYTHLTLPTN